LATDIRLQRDGFAWKEGEEGPYAFLDVEDVKAMTKCVVDNGIDWMIHLGSILSLRGEQQHKLALDVNLNGTRNALDVARKLNLRLLAPSTIAVFGPASGKLMTPDDTKLCPTTIYGITKVFLEQLGNYYHKKFGVDFRCIRYPGIISHNIYGGGTSDYAVHMYQAAMTKSAEFVSGVAADEPLPMMYMPDCISSTMTLLEAPPEVLKRRVYNVSSMSFTPAQLHTSIQKLVPSLQVTYEPNILQNIAHSWPDSVDDSNARKDWGWKPQYDLEAMTADMILQLTARKVLV
jgi:threonine 3-dehydrogenase